MKPVVYSLHTTLSFGKYKGESVRAIIDNDPSYIEWALDNIKWFTLDDDAQYALDHAEDPYLPSSWLDD